MVAGEKVESTAEYDAQSGGCCRESKISELLHSSIQPLDRIMSGPSSKPNPRARQQALNAKYGSPLPILLPNSATAMNGQKGKSKSILSAYTSSFTAHVEVPKCTGVYDPVTRSVWVVDREDMDILFRRGFFGKGTLSRSEPSWRERRVDLVKGGSCASTQLSRGFRKLIL